MAAERIDVLAVMDVAQGTLRLAARGGDFSLAGNQTMAHQDSIAIAEARAAVAELIEQRDRYENALHLIASGNQRPGHVNAITKARMAEIARAALARVQGEGA